MACALQGRQGMLLANQRTDEKVVAMRSRPTGAAPTINADASAVARSELAVGKAHHRHGP